MGAERRFASRVVVTIGAIDPPGRTGPADANVPAYRAAPAT